MNNSIINYNINKNKYTNKTHIGGTTGNQNTIAPLKTTDQVIIDKTTDTFIYLGDKLFNAVAKSFGYIPIQQSINTKNSDSNSNLYGLSALSNIVDKIGTHSRTLDKHLTDQLAGLSLCFINKLNEIFTHADNQGQLDQAIQQTQQFIDKVLQGVQQKLNDPVFVASLKDTTLKASYVAEDIVVAASPQAQHILDELVPIVTKMVQIMIKTIISIILNTLSDIPGLNIVVSLLRDMVAISMALSTTINSASMTSRLFNRAYQDSLKKFIDLSNARKKTQQRINNSSKQLENTDKKI